MPHLSQMARDTLERLSLPASTPAAPVTGNGHWPLRLLGAGLIAGGVSQGVALSLLAWPAWLMLGGGLYLIVRR